MENKNTYIVYVDESNISSKKGNSVYISLYIEFINKDNITNKILDIESNLNISYVHWSEMPWKLRVKFAEKIKNLSFSCIIALYKNPIVQKNILEDFLIKVLKDKNSIYKIIIDGSKSKGYEIKLKKVLKNRSIKFKKIIFIDDKKEPILRLADFIVGSFRSYIDDNNLENKYIYQLLKHKIKILN